MTSMTGLKILVVEDEVLVALMIEDMLLDLECEVVGSARNVADALSLLDGRLIDGAVLDLNLGGETVYPVAEALAASGIPFVFLTGYGAAGIDLSFSRVPAIAKPFHLPALEKALDYFRKGVGASPR
jgi:CheY-like chemotaxis protein